MSDTPSKAEKGPAPQGTGKETTEAPVAVGRSQQGEAAPSGPVTSRVPRGVGEPASDALAEGAEGVRKAQEQVHAQVDRETAQGYRGEVTDPTPNEAYTVAGVTSGMPTPETTVYTPRGK